MAFGVSTLWSKSRMSEEGCPQPAATATAPEALAAVMSAGLSPTKSMPVGGTPTSTAASITDAGYRAAGRGQARRRFGQSGPIHGGDGRHEDGYDGRYLLNPRTNRNAASTCLISSVVRRPAASPSLRESTAVVCSTSTRVSPPGNSTSGRKLAASADVEVGATSQVDNARKSDCTTTAKRGPDCSCPLLPLGLRNRNTSPRTQCLHVTEDLSRLGAILLVRGKRSRLRTQLFLGTESGGIDQC